MTGSRAGSPLASGAPSRANSPGAGPGSRAGSPVAPGVPNGGQKSNKRKADDMPNGTSVSTMPNGANHNMPKAKKRKSMATGAPGVVSPVGDFDEKMVIDWVRNTPNATTRDCIQHFTPYLSDESKKAKFTSLVKEVAQLKGGVLVLKNAYRDPSSLPPSAAGTPAA